MELANTCAYYLNFYRYFPETVGTKYASTVFSLFYSDTVC